MIIFPAQVLASVEHILQLLVGCIIDLSSEHLLVFCHLSLFLFSLCLFDCAEDSSHSASFRSSSVPLPFPLGGRRRSIWERGERYKGTSICRYLLDVPFHISPCEDFIIQERYLHIVIYYVNLQLVTLSRQFVLYIYVKILLII